MQDRLIALRQVISIVGIKRSTIYRRMNAGGFPRSRQLSRGCVRWSQNEIWAWIDGLPISSTAPSNHHNPGSLTP